MCFGPEPMSFGPNHDFASKQKLKTNAIWSKSKQILNILVLASKTQAHITHVADDRDINKDDLVKVNESSTNDC
jgi:hypothetical protein